MIVTPLPYGRMCNRLVLATHFICHVEKHGGSYLHLAFIDYARYFENTRRSGVVFYRSTHGDAGGNARKSLFRFESIHDKHLASIKTKCPKSVLENLLPAETYMMFIGHNHLLSYI